MAEPQSPKPPSVPPQVEGYPKLAGILGLKPEIAIFKRFAKLQAENLLFLQAELLQLEQDLEEIVLEDLASANPVTQSYARSYWAMRYASEHGDGLQWRKRTEIKEKLKEYSITLPSSKTQRRPGFTKVSADLSLRHQIPLPSKQWVDDPTLGNYFPDTPGERLPWGEVDDPINEDLFCLKPRPGENDTFTTFIQGPVLNYVHDRVLMLVHHYLWKIPKFEKLIKRMKRSSSSDVYARAGFVEYADSTTLRLADGMSTVVASMFPAVTTIVLYFIQSSIVRLGVTVAFTAGFALALSVFTKARRIEIFSATAAYAAVLVVFIGTNGSNGSMGSNDSSN
ncbi:hypothetical protein MMC25_000769 [Agyrium rufum]|nr:hypothetical protein [Agyrium rufum]